MQPYKHTQVGWVMLIAGTLIAAATLVSFFVINKGQLATTDAKVALGVGVGVDIVLFVLFPTLTITVNHEKITATFGVGLIRFTFPTSAVVGARPVRNHWLMGVGIRFVPGILLLNVSGLRAVEVKFADRNRLLRLGTDDPQGLLAALKHFSGKVN